MNLKQDPVVEEFMFAVNSQKTQELYLKNLRYFLRIEKLRIKIPTPNKQEKEHHIFSDIIQWR